MKRAIIWFVIAALSGGLMTTAALVFLDSTRRCQGRVIGLWLTELEDPDPAVQDLARDVLLEALLDWYSTKRLLAAKGLVFSKVSFPSRSLATFEKSIKDSEPIIREYTVEMLARVDAPVEEILPLVRRGVEDDEWIVRAAAARTLATMIPRTESALPLMVRMLTQDSQTTVRQTVLYVWRQLRLDLKVVFPEYCDLLSDPEVSIRLSILESIEIMDSVPDHCVERIKQLAEDPSDSVREQAEIVLRKLKSREGK